MAEEEGVSVAEWLRRSAAESPTAEDAQRAHKAVALAIKDGSLLREPCEICGASAIAHHDDYSMPLEVRWLCRKHHREWHRDNPTGIKWPSNNVVVYVPKEEWQSLERRGYEPAAWVRSAVKASFQKANPLDPRVDEEVWAVVKATAEAVSPPGPRMVISSGEVGIVRDSVLTDREGEWKTEEAEPPAKGCVDHRGDPEDWCEACLKMEEG